MEPARRIQDIVCDPQIAVRAIANSPVADRCILALFTPRSGSSWITKIVNSTGLLGHLEEYINPEFIYDVAQKMCANDPATLIAMLTRWAKSANGVFSMKARALDIDLLGEAEFFDAFGVPTAVFFLWRDNIVAQGISLYRAVATNRYHSTDARVTTPQYDAAGIGQWMRHIVAIENENLALMERRNLQGRFLRYEDITRDRRTALSIFSDALRIDLTEERLAASEAGQLRKIADDWNHDAEERFRREQCDFIRDLDAQRLIRLEPHVMRQRLAADARPWVHLIQLDSV
jgi:trehalose 2-sulfotransferase